MKEFSTADRLKQIMDARGLRQTDILRMAKPYCEKYDIKIGKSDLSQFVSGKVEPGQWKLTVLGLALNVSEAWLMGYDVPMERGTAPASIEGSGRSSEFSALFDRLDSEQQALIMNAIKGFLSDR